MKVHRLQRVGKVLTFAGITGLLLSITGLFIPNSAFAVTQTTDSTQTFLWSDTHSAQDSTNFASYQNFRVTVSQTTNLTHQGIVVSWSGAPTTSAGDFSNNYLQVMQCWGDNAEPTPEQCQFGAPSTTLVGQAGTGALGRALELGDPNQTYGSAVQIPPTIDHPLRDRYAYKFTPAPGGGDSTFDVTNYFTSATTNEISAARTGSDGTGQLTFEAQTALESPQLGCGADVRQSDGTTYPRPCWLVIVPRGVNNPNGTLGSNNPGGRISGSPFSGTNWRDRIVIPLGFQSVSHACPMGQAEQRVVGTELIADAITSWQPALCGSGTTYGYSQIGDDEARAQIVSTTQGASHMAFVSGPLSSAESSGKKIVYGPVAKTAIVVAYNIDYDLHSDAPAAAKNGTKVTNLVLNARLIAKLLTQSYAHDVPGAKTFTSDFQANAIIRNNPFSIAQDPEFLALNPDFVGWSDTAPEGLFVALGSSDFNKHVWEWLRSDADAKAFLSGQADPYGMKINPAYANLGLADGTVPDSFPKADLTTFKATTENDEPGYGTLALRPYYNDLNSTAYQALRADGQVKDLWDITKTPSQYSAIAAQSIGSRFILALTDATAATRYGLDTAALVNRSGHAVNPTSQTITAGLTARAATSVQGVTAPDFTRSVSGAYPLSELTYAAVNVCGSDAKERNDYAKLMAFAAGAGQTSGLDQGDLPPGYVPLTNGERTELRSSSSAVKNLSCRASTSSATTTPTSSSNVPATSNTSSSTQAAAGAISHFSSSVQGDPSISSVLSAGGIITSIPLLIIGPLMVRRSRELEAGKVS